MRQLTPLTNLMLSCISALGLLLSLELPWYAHPAVDVPDGRVEAVGAQIARTFTSGDTISGSDVLGSRSTLLYIVAAVVIALSIAMLVPALREPFRDMLRGISLVSPLAVVVMAVRAPAPQQLELRWGLIITVGIAVFMASAAWQGSSARSPRAVAAPRARPTA